MFQITTFSSQMAAQNLKAQIDQQITALDDAARILKRQHNSLIPIARLVPEVLCHVFEYVRTAYLHAKSYGGRGITMRWVWVSYVCSGWRSIALGCPRLWNTIDMSYGNTWVREMITHSRGSPLYITGSLYESNVETLQSLLPRHIARLRKLSLSSRSHPGLFQLLDELPASSAPLLEHLSITLSPAHSLPTNVFSSGKSGSQLQQLSLHNCFFRWDLMMPMPVLTSLHVSYDSPMAVKPRVGQIVAALECMPHLEVLELMCIQFSIMDDGLKRPDQRTVHLPYLTFLRILDSSLDECCKLLDHFTFSQATRLELECTNAGALRGLSRLIPSLERWANRKHHARGMDPIVTKMECSFLAYRPQQVLTLWAPHTIDETPLLSPGLSYMEIDDEETVGSDMAALMSALPLENLEELRIRCFPGVVVDSGWLRPFMLLSTLVFQFCMEEEEDSGQEGIVPGSKAPFTLSYPVLSCLEIAECNLQNGEELLEALNDFLLERFEHGYGIRSLQLSSNVPIQQSWWSFCNIW
ncbi:hypothetical protein Hypma_006082 [Hypsizygus marmoreus]|uniref:Uncharacterized protein n=1 Tax=Hypsizygus marmoreus TaxID=39966 RepID=A0A369K4D1_HYPMA|nr:hypothetical protein Hypma_006082 [Hypsizygus marmoreus]